VDDEKTLADIAGAMLQRLGYEVTVRTSSVEALELFRQDPERFDLIITDMTMPQLTGDKLAREVMGIRPEKPVILCTGFSEKMSQEQARALGIRDFLLKPLIIRDLAEAVKGVLEN
jgi:CheY-like chemotaxis protein